ncbi:MAG: transcriptional repressor [Thermoleophilaceae bacterium]
MTVAPKRPAREVGSLEEAFAALREAGYRLSAARRLLLEALFAAEGPVSAEYIADGLGGRAIASDLPSTYRNLETLEAFGLVRHFHMGHGPGLYMLAGRPELEYLACERCGRVTSVDPIELDPIRDRIREAFGYEASFRHFPMVGRCADCAATDAQEPRKPATRPHPRTGGDMDTEGHSHEHAHEHEHDGEAHSHAHTSHEHEHTEHDHEHDHGDRVHGHSHAHVEGHEQDHANEHED